ncbi:hypothetical protein DN824_06755 [Stutzerimonas nosocomialis]|uniref:Uncharacterized protein n=1 Tax=Stutzerimonas nosocomialis TaxID=1056496 RepID=A0A5R9QFD5_9GAMM|nr:hypothetical protein [Stutzerimonas nosocomialis]TLX59871.1 hypothetical protein DN824_06755 [Stutzerimonas nosocomialis]TLX63887.1 hypothetical protein DN820_09320 [Stutzerimonas nosocomialis]
MSQAHDKLVGSVPARIAEAAHFSLTAYEGRVAEFHVAAWLQLPGLANQNASLLVRYRDGQQRREVPVDHGRVSGNGKVLLSGIARLSAKTKIEDMQVVLRPPMATEGMVVEELFVQAAEAVVTAGEQAATA